MIFVFWQNVVSIHQSAFIKALSKEHDVTLVACETIDEQRRLEKWTVPSMGSARVLIAPEQAIIDSLLDTPKTYHVFSGINAFPMIYKAFKGAVKRGLKVSIMAEPYDWAGIKGAMRRVMYSMLFLRFGHNISHFFATGHMGILCYHKAGLPIRKLHHWGYFTEQVDEYSKVVQSNCHNDMKTVNLIYAGRIDANKNILKVLRGFKFFGENVNQFTIVGDGPLMDELRTIAENNPKIKLLGRINNNEVRKVMAEHDYLILPSLYDGWGAVINEALGVGTAVLCSEACGASILIDGKVRGQHFSSVNMFDILKKNCDQGPVSGDRRKAIANWASEHISGTVAANYFVATINGMAPKTPWL